MRNPAFAETIKLGARIICPTQRKTARSAPSIDGQWLAALQTGTTSPQPLSLRLSNLAQPRVPEPVIVTLLTEDGAFTHA